MKKTLFSLFFMVCFFAVAQEAMAQRTLTGKVVDKKNAPIIGVSIVIKGTTSGTITDGNGNFVLPLENGAKVITASFAGESQDVSIKADEKTTQIQFKSTLKQLQKQLDKLNSSKGKGKKK